MKQLLLIGLSGILLIFGAGYIHQSYGIQENELYPEERLDLLEVEVENANTFLTRGEALEAAYSVFGEGLGISLLDMDLSMHMNLYSDSDAFGAYKWLLSWNRGTAYESYTCTIDAMEGRILSLYVVGTGEEPSGKKSEPLKKSELLEIAKPLLQAMDMEISEYKMKVKKKPVIIGGVRYIRCFYTNRKEEDDAFMIEIEEAEKRITIFDRDTGVEE